MPHFVFIDTNILLDFYRIRGQDTYLSILNHIDENHNKLISTYQVEMEYKKNRQKVILETLQSLKTTSLNAVPAFLKDSKPNQVIATAEKQVKSQVKKLRERTINTLSNPGRKDPVYQTSQRLFRASGNCHLNREKKIRFQIRELAQKRFALGYPPRKKDDTSIGDAINWEWILHCASECDHDIVIVSRDTDYGIVVDGEAYLNDWLLQEFKQRISARRKIVLTTRLTEAFKHAGIRVSNNEVKQEEKLIRSVIAQPKTTEIRREDLGKLILHFIDKYDEDGDTSSDDS